MFKVEEIKNIIKIKDKIFRKKRKKLDVVIIIPYREKDKKILVIEEYRKDFNKKVWKLISGGMDKENLTALETAKEELAEEVSRESKKWYRVDETGKNEKKFNKSRVSYFAAENPIIMENPPGNPDEDDIILNERWINLDELWKMVDERKFLWCDSIFIAIKFLRNKNKK